MKEAEKEGHFFFNTYTIKTSNDGIQSVMDKALPKPGFFSAKLGHFNK